MVKILPNLCINSIRTTLTRVRSPPNGADEEKKDSFGGGREKAAASGQKSLCVIVEAARRLEVALLVVGQKKRAARSGGVAEYCVQNASCMALAVRRRSKRVGGYLITTKTHKDFWLLA